MGNYKKDFKKITAKMRTVPFLTDENIHMTQEDIRRLIAFDLIKSEPWDGVILRYTLTLKGEFFEDFQQERRKELLVIGAKEFILTGAGSAIGAFIGYIVAG